MGHHGRQGPPRRLHGRVFRVQRVIRTGVQGAPREFVHGGERRDNARVGKGEGAVGLQKARLHASLANGPQSDKRAGRQRNARGLVAVVVDGDIAEPAVVSQFDAARADAAQGHAPRYPPGLVALTPASLWLRDASV